MKYLLITLLSIFALQLSSQSISEEWVRVSDTQEAFAYVVKVDGKTIARVFDVDGQDSKSKAQRIAKNYKPQRDTSLDGLKLRAIKED